MSERHTYQIRSPGRVNLIGEHTDYTYGHVLPMATNLHTQLDATPSEDVTVKSETVGDQQSFATDDRQHENSWIGYIKGCYAILAEEGYDPGGFDGEISNTLPIDAGLSSSASN